MIEVMFHVRKDNFAAYPAVIDELDLVEEEDQITHMITLDDAQDPENMLNVFRLDTEWEKNEEMYEEIKKEILGDDDEEEEEEAEDAEGAGKICWFIFHLFLLFEIRC
jgi:pre-mRNA-splicing factor CWC22